MSISRIDQSQNKKPYSGFVNRVDSTISIDGSGVFTIQPAVDDYEIYTESRGKISLDSAQTVSVTDDQTITFIYFDKDGVIQSSTSVWDITDGDMIPVSVVFKDATVYTLTDERHGYQRDLEWHRWAHLTVGTRYFSGFTGAFTDTTFSVAQGVIFDEDIRFDSGGTETTASLWYRNATNGMRMERNSTVPKYVSGGIIQYDDGSGTPIDVTNNRYVTNWVFATNDPDEPIYTVIGQNDSITLVGAQNADYPTINLDTAEWKLIYRLIFQRTNATPDGELIEVEDFRTEQSFGSSGAVSPSSHTALTDRDALNSHPLGAITSVVTEVPYGGATGLTSESVFNYNESTDTLSVPNIEFTGLIDGVTSDGIQVGSDLDEFKIGLSLYRSGSFIGGIDNSGGDFRLKAQNANDIQLINDGNVGLQVTDSDVIDVVGSPTISSSFQGLISHTNITDIGTNTHAQIDTHIADSTIHFTEASIDHGNISGLTDDDHAQYALLAGRSTGQTLIGGTGAGDDLELVSTSNAIKGNIYFGSDRSADDTSSTYDEVNDRWGFGINQNLEGKVVIKGDNQGDTTYALSVYNNNDDLIFRVRDNGQLDGEYFNFANNSTSVGNGSGSMTATDSVFIGDNASSASPDRSIHIGARAGEFVSSSPYENVDIGYYVSRFGGGTENTVVGTKAAQYSTGGSKACFGYRACENSGSGGVYLGHKAGQNETGNNKLYIANSNTTSPLIYGEFDNNILDVNGDLTVTGTTADNTAYALTIDDSASSSLFTVRNDGEIEMSSGGSLGSNLKELILESIYPVGSIYINANISTNPATLLGIGTWTAFGAGRVPVGIDSGDTDFDTAEETGGSKTHTLTISEMPSHTHPVVSVASDGGGGTDNYTVSGIKEKSARTSGSTGGGDAHNNVQPYIVVYMWKRTA